MLKIDAGSAVPVYEQLKRQIKLKVISGKYQPDSKLPSIRQLASELKINPNTIAKVYRQLESENILYSKAYLRWRHANCCFFSSGVPAFSAYFSIWRRNCHVVFDSVYCC